MRRKIFNLEDYDVSMATHHMLCSHACGSRVTNYVMLCLPIGETIGGNLRIVLFGERFWGGGDKRKRIAYVDPERVSLK